MKKLIVILTIIMSASFAASAQTLERNGRFLYMNGERISDQEIMNIISPSVYSETYLGARKQVQAGRNLRIGGLTAMGVGLGFMVAGAADESYLSSDSSSNNPFDDWSDEAAGKFILGYCVMFTGAMCVEASIPLSIIGKKRLNWIAEDYNSGNHASRARLEFGSQDHGFGLALKF